MTANTGSETAESRFQALSLKGPMRSCRPCWAIFIAHYIRQTWHQPISLTSVTDITTPACQLKGREITASDNLKCYT